MTHHILSADETRLAEIEVWLDDEEAASKAWEDSRYEGDPPVRGFRCNWNSAKRWWREGTSKIWVLIVDDEAVGFLVGTDILEIRPDLRGSGYGGILAEFMVETVRADGNSVIKIEIAPSSAEPFWRRMGFTPVEDRSGGGGGTFAFKVLPRTFALGDGDRVAYAISYLTQKERYMDEPTPFARFAGLGERLADGRIQLPERAFCFNPVDDQHVDYFVKIEVEGRLVHFDKAKYEGSRDSGIERDAGYDFFIERINAVQSSI
ncbi:GNAT family N-acetyltransferase [Rhizobium leguminosarum]|uniref:GNAT family N-acetyltransferase n=1 Tax=Rhizobium leguminosarum TaxID=384 RepID=UPI00103B34FF|nr:GNAT family N-acetyltransferase [Rhizobium leguminosarum]TBZ99467.1 GNAT family N-acetyltransferase [Rhizobium leguminosarum bv. viciae]